MPDFTEEVFFHCVTAEHFKMDVPSSSDPKTVYKVSLGYSHEPRDAQYEWSCECKGFKMRHKCRHIDRAKNSPMYCGWNGFTDGGEVTYKGGDPLCPNCGSLAKALRYAV